jgi:hypothetical protein
MFKEASCGIYVYPLYLHHMKHINLERRFTAAGVWEPISSDRVACRPAAHIVAERE